MSFPYVYEILVISMKETCSLYDPRVGHYKHISRFNVNKFSGIYCDLIELKMDTNLHAELHVSLNTSTNNTDSQQQSRICKTAFKSDKTIINFYKTKLTEK